jgi:hypothetical protein
MILHLSHSSQIEQRGHTTSRISTVLYRDPKSHVTLTPTLCLGFFLTSNVPTCTDVSKEMSDGSHRHCSMLTSRNETKHGNGEGTKQRRDSRRQVSDENRLWAKQLLAIISLPVCYTRTKPKGIQRSKKYILLKDPLHLFLEDRSDPDHHVFDSM